MMIYEGAKSGRKESGSGLLGDEQGKGGRRQSYPPRILCHVTVSTMCISLRKKGDGLGPMPPRASNTTGNTKVLKGFCLPDTHDTLRKKNPQDPLLQGKPMFSLSCTASWKDKGFRSPAGILVTLWYLLVERWSLTPLFLRISCHPILDHFVKALGTCLPSANRVRVRMHTHTP